MCACVHFGPCLALASSKSTCLYPVICARATLPEVSSHLLAG